MGVRSIKTGAMLAWDRVEVNPTPLRPVCEFTPPSHSDATSPAGPPAQALSLLMGHITQLSDDEVPIQGALVQAGPRSCRTDADGLYRLCLDRLEIPVTITVTAPGFFRRVERLDWSPILSGGLLLQDFQLVENRSAPPLDIQPDEQVVECSGVADPLHDRSISTDPVLGLEAGESDEVEEDAPGGLKGGVFSGLDRLELPMQADASPGNPASAAPTGITVEMPEATTLQTCSIESLSEALASGAYVPPAVSEQASSRLPRHLNRLVSTLLEPPDELLLLSRDWLDDVGGHLSEQRAGDFDAIGTGSEDLDELPDQAYVDLLADDEGATLSSASDLREPIDEWDDDWPGDWGDDTALEPESDAIHRYEGDDRRKDGPNSAPPARPL